jgi:hypothetical protein
LRQQNVLQKLAEAAAASPMLANACSDLAETKREMLVMLEEIIITDTDHDGTLVTGAAAVAPQDTEAVLRIADVRKAGGVRAKVANGYHERPGSLWVAFDHSQYREGRMDFSKAPTRSAAALVARSEMAAGCIGWMSGQNANRCASFVSVGTRFRGLFRLKWLKWLKPALKRKRGFLLIL